MYFVKKIRLSAQRKVQQNLQSFTVSIRVWRKKNNYDTDPLDIRFLQHTYDLFLFFFIHSYVLELEVCYVLKQFIDNFFFLFK